jgi:hypothetical protein
VNRRAHELAARAAERAARDVPPLAGALRRAKDLTCQEPPW